MPDLETLIRQLQGAVKAAQDGVRVGTGSPEGSVDAPGGTLFRRTDGPPWLYVKQSLTGTTGWVAK